MIVPKNPADAFLEKVGLGPQPPAVAPNSLTSFVTVAPDDSSLVAGQFKLWLDDSPGSPKLMIKAKDSGGTVRTGSVTLT